jgi:hypothetical protein
MKPNAGIGRWSLDFVLKIVFFMFVGAVIGTEELGLDKDFF